jgi:hypothetical protein
VTEGSFDTYMWQTLERKAAIIAQVTRGDLPDRDVDNIGDQALSFAEVKALATGDPLVLERLRSTLTSPASPATNELTATTSTDCVAPMTLRWPGPNEQNSAPPSSWRCSDESSTPEAITSQ